MRSMTRAAASLTLAVLTLATSTRVVQAACNLIPLARTGFVSTMGALTSPITAPGKTVEIKVGGCDGSAGFEPFAADNTVILTFEPPTGIDTPVPVTVGAVADCSLPGGRCTTLRFTTPNTAGYLAPYGLAGPARIVVTDLGAATVAEIGTLSLPTTGCDQQPEQVFGQFTVLPPANSMAELVSGAAPELIATVDGNGNLLVPLDHWGGGGNSVLAETPGAPVAILLAGTADLAAQGAGDPNRLLDVLAAQPDSARFVRSFTLDGRPLPPLLRITEGGELFGTADAVESVLRLQRNDGEGGPDLFDLSDRLDADRGPIRIATYSAERRDPLPLVSLRAASDAVGYVRDESRESAFLNPDGDQTDLVVQVVDAATGLPTNTQRAVTIVTETAITTPAIVSTSNIVAFLESERGQGVDYDGDTNLDDSVLRVYLGDGTPLTAATTIEADAVPLVNRRTAAISEERVFFRTPSSLIASLTDGVGGVDGLGDPIGLAISPDGRHVYVGASDDAAVGVFARDLTTGALSFVETEPVPFGGLLLGISPDGLHVYVHTYTVSPTLTVLSRNPVTGALTFVEQHVDDVGGVDGLDGYGDVTFSPDGLNVYVGAGSGGGPPEDQEIAVFRRNPLTGALTFLEAVGDMLDTSGVVVSPDGLHAYGTRPPTVRVFDRNPVDGTLDAIQTVSGDGRDLAISDDGRHLYLSTYPCYDADCPPNSIAQFDRDPATGLITPVEEWGIPGGSQAYNIDIAPNGMRIAACGPEGAFLLERDVRSGSLENVATIGEEGCFNVVVSPDGRDVYEVTSSSNTLNGHRVNGGLAVFDAGTPALRSVGIPATRVAVANGRALFLEPEDFAGVDRNGDGDQRDHTVRLLDATGPADVVTSLGVAGRRVALSDELMAFTVPEGSEDAGDRNGDFDLRDSVLAVAELGSMVVRDVGVAADVVAVSGSTVVFARPEWMEPASAELCAPTMPPGGCDLNGNGRNTDRVLHVYRHKKGGVGKVENLGMQVSFGNQGFEGIYDRPYTDRTDLYMVGNVVTFLSDEEVLTGVDLSGNFSFTDHALLMANVAVNPTELINPALMALPCTFPSCEPAVPYRIDPARGTVSFVVWEANQGVDLDGNGDFLDFVLSVYNLVNGGRQVITLFPFAGFGADSDVARLPEPFIDGQLVYSEVRESDVGVDLNGDGAVTAAVAIALSGDTDGDGVFDDFDSCVEIANADGIDVDGDRLGDTACDPNPVPCPPAPLPGCATMTQAGKGKLQLKDDADDGKDQVAWSWNKGAATDVAAFGNPVDGVAVYSLCVYDASLNPQPVLGSGVMPARICDVVKGKPCWKRTGQTGLQMKDKAGAQGGLTQITLKAGAAGKAKAQVKGKGVGVPMPSLPLSLPARAQLIVYEGDREACWEATFSGATQNGPGRFKAKSD